MADKCAHAPKNYPPNGEPGQGTQPASKFTVIICHHVLTGLCTSRLTGLIPELAICAPGMDNDFKRNS